MGAHAAEREHPVQGYVIDNLTGENIPGATVMLMTADSSVISTTTTLDYPPAPELSGCYHFTIKHVGRYILKATCIGYEPNYQYFEMKSNRQGAILVKTIRLTKTVKELPEVVVRATKLKMIYSGDTIIYNADAFKVAEGSMLDALIEQLPGVRISDEGVITVNGKYVESLLLNGRDFFRNNPKMALKNLPAYTVGRVKVYRQQGDASVVMQRPMDDGALVMDVHLKKEYAVGYMGNAEAGMGTSSRYKARGMGMRFTEVSRTMAYANANNLNDNRRPGYNGNWTPGDMPSGLRSEQAVGGNYMYYIDKRSTFQTENLYSHSCSNLQRGTNTQTFLPEGDVFRESFHHARNQHNSFSSRNTLRIQKEAKFFNNSYLRVSLTDGAQNASDTSRTSSLSLLLNQQLYQQKSNSRDFSFSAGTEQGIRVVVDMLRLNASMDYSESAQKVFAQNRLFYFNASENNEFRHTYRTSPNHRIGLKAGLGYAYVLGNSTLEPSYRYAYSYRKSVKERYRLDRLTSADSTGIDVLPSVAEDLVSVMDVPNSYIYRLNSQTHTLSTKYTWAFGLGHLVVNLPLRWSLNALAAQRVVAHSVRRNALFFEPEVSLSFYPPTQSTFSIDLSYKMATPDLTDLINFRDDSNPLHVRLGNPSLQNTRQFNASADFSQRWEEERTLYAKAQLHMTDRAVAQGVEVDRLTGVTTSRPENVDGNWELSGETGVTTALDKRQRIMLDIVLRPSFRHHVDLTRAAGDWKSSLSTIKEWSLKNELKLSFQPNKKLLFRAKAKAEWSRMESTMAGFERINVWNISGGLSAVVDLPWKMQLTTDLAEFLRRGYRSEEMNTSELIWNVRLSKSLLKGHLLFAIDAFDVLGQQKAYSYRLNAQGRTEIWTNTLPRYALLSVSYNFHVNPKKKPQKE